MLGLLTCAPSVKKARAQTLSPHAQISIWTIDPADQYIYTAFGHNAIRIQDTTQYLDIVFHYGLFDFNDPNFYVNYMKGHLMYQMGANYTHDFLAITKSEQRSLYAQPLDLSAQEKTELYDRLLWNYMPENRAYRYDYYDDNCATRVRDMLMEYGPKAQFNTPYLATPYPSFRALMNARMANFTWTRLAINLLFGYKADIAVSPHTAMFLPENLREALKTAQKPDQTPLITSTHTLYKAPPIETKTIPLSKYLLWGALVWLIMSFNTERKKPYIAIDIALLALYAILGTVMVVLWAATDHTVTQYNYDLIWMHPLHLVPIGWIAKKKYRPVAIYLIAQGALIVLYAGVWAIWRPALPLEYVPLMGMLCMRALVYTRFLKKAKTTRPSPSQH